MSRIDGVNPEDVDGSTAAAFAAQEKRWGAPLLNHLVYARRPTIYRAARGMWGGLDASGLLDPKLVALLNRRVAIVNRCVF